ncbi:hypothetical protein HON36_02320 [Candidatus Parcubacteria bacterium]|jgi:hypothetical protein|nr:hypothetical protein [Candidatus Parcubacteria bacterium]MBT7228066.1 hypothetical protein [Candidatus Parcubacteria bacterium]
MKTAEQCKALRHYFGENIGQSLGNFKNLLAELEKTRVIGKDNGLFFYKNKIKNENERMGVILANAFNEYPKRTYKVEKSMPSTFVALPHPRGVNFIKECELAPGVVVRVGDSTNINGVEYKIVGFSVHTKEIVASYTETSMRGLRKKTKYALLGKEVYYKSLSIDK